MKKGRFFLSFLLLCLFLSYLSTSLLSVEFIDTCTRICKNSFSLNKEKGSERQQRKEIMAILSPSEIPQNTFYEHRLGTRFANDSTVKSG